MSTTPNSEDYLLTESSNTEVSTPQQLGEFFPLTGRSDSSQLESSFCATTPSLHPPPPPLVHIYRTASPPPAPLPHSFSQKSSFRSTAPPPPPLPHSVSQKSSCRSAGTPSPPPPPPFSQKFLDQDITSIDPKTILRILDCYPPLNGDEYWKYFEIAYPGTESYIRDLHDTLNNFKKKTQRLQDKEEFKPVDLLYISLKELGDDLVEYLTHLNLNPLFWTRERGCLEREIYYIRDLWIKLECQIFSVINRRIEQPLKFQHRMDSVIYQLNQNLEEADMKISDAWRAQHEQKRRESLGVREILLEFVGRQRDKPWGKLWEDILKLMGSPKVMLSNIILSASAGAITTAAATWKCTPPDTIPTIDSNFWSTLSSSIIALAGLYCILIPRLRGSDLEVNNAMLFYGLLTVSMVTALVSIPTYVYQTRVSLVMLFVSSAAQLAVTLQLILGADAKIIEKVGEIQLQGEMIEGLNSEIAYLRDR